jgi:hypothetical protein
VSDSATSCFNGGRPLPSHLLNVSYRGPVWLTGGVCGMKASVFPLLTVLALFALFHRLYPEVCWKPETLMGVRPRIPLGTPPSTQ